MQMWQENQTYRVFFSCLTYRRFFNIFYILGYDGWGLFLRISSLESEFISGLKKCNTTFVGTF